MDKTLRLFKKIYLQYKQPRLKLKAHFAQLRLFLLVFIITMLQPAGETNLHAKMSEKLRKSSVWSVVVFWIVSWTRFIKLFIVCHRFLMAYIAFARNYYLTEMTSSCLIYLQNLWAVLVALDCYRQEK